MGPQWHRPPPLSDAPITFRNRNPRSSATIVGRGAATGPRPRAGRREDVPDLPLVVKALCYVVRDGGLLVFRHVGASPEEVGVQVPAGTVRPGEPPEAAALREAREETGLDAFTVVRRLGKTDYDISPYRFELQRRHVFHLSVDGPVPHRWRSRELHDGTRPPTELECFWIPLAQGPVLQSGQGALLGRLFDEPRSATPQRSPGRP